MPFNLNARWTKIVPLKGDETRQIKLTELEDASPDVPKNFGSAGALPSRKTNHYSLLAIRCRLWLGRSLALPVQRSTRNPELSTL